MSDDRAAPPAGAEESWHERQDRSVDATVRTKSVEAVNRDDPVYRVWWWSGYELFFNAHALNVQALYRRDDGFRLLDLGCGTAELTARLARAFPNAEFVGLDSNRASIEQALGEPQPPNLRLLVGRFEDAAPLGTFDVVICSEVFEHVEDTDVLVSTIAASLAPGGHLSFSTPSGWMWHRPRLHALVRVLKVGPRAYRRVYLAPERHWREALPHHPATQPSKVRRQLERAGLDVVLRTSSIWHLEPRFGVVYPGLRRLARRRPLRAAQTFFFAYTTLEGLLNVVPPLRVFESRFILLARKRDQVAGTR